MNKCLPSPKNHSSLSSQTPTLLQATLRHHAKCLFLITPRLPQQPRLTAGDEGIFFSYFNLYWTPRAPYKICGLSSFTHFCPLSLPGFSECVACYKVFLFFLLSWGLGVGMVVGEKLGHSETLTQNFWTRVAMSHSFTPLTKRKPFKNLMTPCTAILSICASLTTLLHGKMGAISMFWSFFSFPT